MIAQTTFSRIVTGTTEPATVLVVDDDENTIRILKIVLERAGAHVLSATSGAKALRLTFDHRPDIILLDIAMPEMDGLTVCQRLRDLSDVPIIMLTALSQSEDVTAGFAVGADDYVVKPFGTAELLARIQACLRRAAKDPEAEDNLVLGQGALIVDLRRHCVSVRGTPVHFTRTEFELLVYMMRNRQRVLTHSMLIAAIRGEEAVFGHDSLKQFVATLRRKIELDPRQPQWLLSEHGVGYVLMLE